MAIQFNDLAEVIHEAVKAALLQTADSQKALIKDLISSQSTDAQKITDSLNNRIPKFNYDPEADLTFEKWVKRYKPVIDTDGATLAETMKKNFIVSKLNVKEYDRFIAYLLPNRIEDESLDNIIETLKTLFSQPASLFRRRSKFLQTKGRAKISNSVLELYANQTRNEESTTLESLATELINYTQLKRDATSSSDQIPTKSRVHKSSMKLDRQRGLKASVCRAPKQRADIRHLKISLLENSRILESVRINGSDVTLVLDTGADVTLLAEETWRQLGAPQLRKSDVDLTQADGSSLHILGSFDCIVELNGTEFEGKCYVSK
ncbi:uncharacterized protein LOC108864050 [Galendromus occidentalis]|uniref:Uncharacterized protein LOC108864050 n=1 Tax=Galendromus occidentalis TaxID=34638 RepID=A0AAJ7L5I2_9ACAR|nr:uncharacterized protein LOC108864050 [Galendromus occidentalis]